MDKIRTLAPEERHRIIDDNYLEVNYVLSYPLSEDFNLLHRIVYTNQKTHLLFSQLGVAFFKKLHLTISTHFFPRHLCPSHAYDNLR
jgi:hypothetical protein